VPDTQAKPRAEDCRSDLSGGKENEMDEQNQQSGGGDNPETQQRGGDAGGGSGAPGRGPLEPGMTDLGGRLDGVGTGSDLGAGHGGIAEGSARESGGRDRDTAGGDAGGSSNH
jgi:hypothetical protein